MGSMQSFTENRAAALASRLAQQSLRCYPLNPRLDTDTSALHLDVGLIHRHSRSSV